ncbi:gamma carbonic anhydrase family protein, partial [Streptomyces sp. NPDC058385]
PPCSLVAGVPAKVRRALTEEVRPGRLPLVPIRGRLRRACPG